MDEKLQAEKEAAERKRLARIQRDWRKKHHISLSPPKRTNGSTEQKSEPPNEEALLSDGPAMTELDTPHFGRANRSAASPASPTLVISTQGNRRMSIVAAIDQSHSPLSKASLADEMQGDSHDSAELVSDEEKVQLQGKLNGR